MPKELVLEDGSTVEVPTEEELQELKDAKTKASELEENLTQIQKEKQELEELGGEGLSNLRKAYKRQKKVIQQLRDQGKELDDDGNIVDTKKEIDPEEIKKTVAQTTRQEMLIAEKEKMLQNIAEDKRETVKLMVEKLSQGEELTSETLAGYVEAAKRAAGISGNTETIGNDFNAYAGGGSPNSSPATNRQKNIQKGLDIAKDVGYQVKNDLSNV